MNTDENTTADSHAGDDFTVRATAFEGPLDLLLSLIEEKKLDITMVSLAQITDGYIEYIKERDNISLYHLSDFLTVASRLILIKSKALLPLLKFDDEEEADMLELERQLEALKCIKDAIAPLQAFIDMRRSHYGRVSLWGITPQFIPDTGVTAQVLHGAFVRSLNLIPKLDDIEEKIIADVVSLERKIAGIQAMISQRAHLAFSELVRSENSSANVVVSFLALLELIRQQIVVATQEQAFEDIQMSSREASSRTNVMMHEQS